MTLEQAPFRVPLEVCSFALPEDARLLLCQMGLDAGERIQKVHEAPLGDPVALQIGDQLFTLRKEICRRIRVKELTGR